MCWVLIVRECKVAVFLSVSPNRPHPPTCRRRGTLLCLNQITRQCAWRLWIRLMQEFMMRVVGSYETIWKMGIGDFTLRPSNVTIRHYIGHMGCICFHDPWSTAPDEVFAPHNPLLPTDQYEESHGPWKFSFAQVFRAQIRSPIEQRNGRDSNCQI